MNGKIYDFEVTNLDTVRIYRFAQPVKQKARLPLIGELQKRVCTYLFEHNLAPEVTEMSFKANPEGNHFEMRVIGNGAKLFVKISESKQTAKNAF